MKLNKNTPIIIPEVFNESPICDFVPQTAKILSQNSPVYIYFVNFPKKRFQPNIVPQKNNLFFVYPKEILPLVRFAFIRQINIHLTFFFLHLHCFLKYHSRPLYWFFYPQLASLVKFTPRPQKLVYDIVDNFSNYNSQKKYLLTHSHLVTTISHSLQQSSQKICPNVSIKLVPQGFNIIKHISTNPHLQSINNLDNKVGFIGGIGNRLDYKILLKLVSLTPKINYIFVGPVISDSNTSPKPIKKLTKKLFSFSNVYHFDTVPKKDIFSFIKTFDVCLIPYDISQKFNRDCYPMKLFEYFAAGKPVVATAIHELVYFPDLVKIGHNAQDWAKLINQSLSGLTPVQKSKAQKLAHQNSWQNKLNQTISYLSSL